MQLSKLTLLLAILAGVLLASPAQADPKFNLNNHSGCPDSQLYVAVTGTDPSTGHIQHLSWTTQTFQDISTDDNDPNNNNYCTSYYTTLKQARQADGSIFTLTQRVSSGRLWVSVRKPIYFHVNPANPPNAPNPGLAQPNVNNPSDPNVATLFDWLEFANVPDAKTGILKFTANTTCVDFFALPLNFEMFNGTTSLGKLGFNCSRNIVLQALKANPLLQPLVTPYRAFSPETDNAAAASFPSDYFNTYRDYCWTKYISTTLTISGVVDAISFTASGTVNASNQLVLTDSVHSETYTINLPSSKEIFACNGVFQPVQPPGTSSKEALDRDGFVRDEVASALNRSVMHLDFSQWSAFGNYYKNTLPDPDKSKFKTNIYSQALHPLAINQKIYGYAWDDKYNWDPTLSVTTANVTDIVLTINNSMSAITPTLSLLIME